MRRFVLLVAASFCALPADAVTLEWAHVGNPGNAADSQVMVDATTGYGSVSYGYYISKYEVTNAQYTAFLNAVAASDPAVTGLYPGASGILQSGTDGSYVYSVVPGLENRPVEAVTFWRAARFANWIYNGQPSGAQDNSTTEDGAYTLTAQGIALNTIVRNHAATVFVPSENEWYKAAYFNGTAYFDYPAGTDTQTVCAAPTATANSANCNGVVGPLTDGGAYTGSASPYGTFDQGGNVFEWTDTIHQDDLGLYRVMRGGSRQGSAVQLSASVRYGVLADAYTGTGFRLVSAPVCGNGQVEQGEECDDGNVMNGDGCTSTCTTEPCRNGLDDDGDGLADYPADPGCANPGSPSESPACNNGLDDDGDNLTDFPADPGCRAASSASEAPECDDGIDNDGDGKKDIADSGCYAGDAADRSENVDCGDGIDNDGDGLIDTADPGCLDSNWPSEDPACSDGADNDGDGTIDWLGNSGVPADPQCGGSPFGFTEKPPTQGGCGLGVELALVLLAIQKRVARSRRR